MGAALVVTARRWVGLFTLVGLAILLAGVVALTSDRLFAQHRTFVVFFPHAVGGLKDGAPVSFRQVPVGEVRDVELVFTGRGVESQVKVIVDMRRGAVRDFQGQGQLARLSDEAFAKTVVQAGLRASVRSSSPIGGQKSVDLDFHPELKARFSGLEMPYPEIPSAPTGLEVLSEKIDQTLQRVSEVPIDEVLLQLGATLESVETLVEGGDVKGAIRSLRRTLDTADRTLARAEKTMGTVDGVLDVANSTLSRVEGTARSLHSTLEQVNRTLATVDRNVERSGDLQYAANKALDDLDEVLKSLQSLVETLQRHPESLVRGKSRPEEKK